MQQKIEKPKRQPKWKHPHYFFITERIERWATSPRKCRSSRGKQSGSQIQWSWISQGLLLFSSLRKPESFAGIVLESARAEIRSKSVPQFRLMVNEVASRQTSFLGWFMRLFAVFFFLQSAVCIYDAALLPLRNRTLLHLSFNWNQRSKILFIPERASYHFVHMLKYGLYMLCPWWLDDSLMLRQNLIFKANIRDDREGATCASGHL